MSASRRQVLKGLLGGATVTLGLPWLEAHLGTVPVAAATTDSGLPRCFGMFYWANGVLPDRFEPIGSGKGDAWQLSEQLQPMARHKSKLAVVSNLEVRHPNAIPHLTGAGGFLTGRAALGTDDSWTFGGPSIDQIIGDAIGGTTRFKSLEFGPDAGTGLSYTGPYQALPPERDPFALFTRVFGAGFTLPGEEPLIDPTWALRRSVLDAVLEDANRLKQRLGTNDAQRIEAHMDGVRDLEQRLARLELTPPDLASCAVPVPPEESYDAIKGRPQLIAMNQAFSEVAAMALACDQTRVVSNYFSHPVSNVLHPDALDGHHNLTHDEPDPQDGVNDIILRSMGAFADFLDALDAIQEVDGCTLLDRCAIIGFSDVSYGRQHTLDRFPFVVAGSAGGHLALDQHVAATVGDSTGRAILTVARAVGVDLPDFGENDHYTDMSISELEA